MATTTALEGPITSMGTSSRAKPRLDTVPLEVLNDIITSLPIPSLAALSITCRVLHLRTEPVLYKSIDWQFNNCRTTGSANPPIHIFLRSLRQNSRLASHIRSVHFGAGERGFHLDEFVDLSPSPDEAGLWLGALEELCDPIQDRLGEDVSIGEIGALTTLLISQLPNLEVLRLDFSVAVWSYAFETIFRHRQSPPPQCTCPRFPRIKQIRVENDMDCDVLREGGYSIESFTTSGFSSLVFLDLLLINSITDDDIASQLPNLKTLRIMNCGVSMDTVAVWLSTAPNLQTFEYFRAQNLEKLKYDRRYRLGDWGEWEDFTTALTEVSGSLKSLIISVDWGHIDDYPPDTMDDDWVDGVWERKGSLTSLKSFGSLERLESPIVVLLGWTPGLTVKRPQDILPSTLRELHLRDDLCMSHDYRWTTRTSTVTARASVRISESIPDSKPLLVQLRGYLSNGSDIITEDHPASSLSKLCLKVQSDRAFTSAELMELEQLSRKSGVLCTIHERKRNLHYTDVSDESVKEIVLYDPSNQAVEVTRSELPRYKERYLTEPTRMFVNNC